MVNMLLGYARVSTQDQDLSLQLDALTNYGCVRIFEEKVSGRSRQRPELDHLLEVAREGDTVVVWKLDRLGRSLKNLIELMEYFRENKINFVSLKENIDTTSASGEMMFYIFALIAEYEREVTVERTRAGVQAARARGRFGGRPKIEKSKRNMALKMYDSQQYTIKEITEATGVSKATIYRYVKENQKEKGGH